MTIHPRLHQPLPRGPGPASRLSRLALAFAALTACVLPGLAAAQSQVTLYGVMDIALAKYDAQRIKSEATGATSRIGVRGSEDLGGGLKAIFQLEHQLNPDTGTQYNAGAFWSGRATVGLEGGFGRVTLGREVNPSHFVEAGADPFTQDGTAGGYGSRGGISQANGAPGQIDTVRMNNAINYAFTASNLTFRAQTAAREGADPTGNRPYAASVIYNDGTLQLGASYLNPSKPKDHWAYVSGTYDFKAAKLFAGLGQGVNAFSQKIRQQILGASVPVGLDDVRTTVSRTTSNGTVLQTKLALGYFHNLSKRTTVYADVVHDGKAGGFVYGPAGWAATGVTIGKTGYDVGLKHVF